MKSCSCFIFSVLAASVFAEPSVSSVRIRQDWPWSSKILVDYTLAGVSEEVDVSVKAFNGDILLALSDAALSGKRYCIGVDGNYRIEIDPQKAFGQIAGYFDKFNIDVSVSPASSSSKEVLYKIFDLEEKTVEDVTRGRLLNGEYGAYETDYSRIDSSYVSPLESVLIWTGVTNYPGAKTTKLVMRRIPAGGFEFPHQGKWNASAKYSMNISKPFYIGVFEVTQSQFKYFYAPKWFSPARTGDELPASGFNVQYTLYNGQGDKGHIWIPEDGGLDTLNDMFGGKYVFNLPTQAMWYRAMRADSTTYFYDGIVASPDSSEFSSQLAKIGRFSGTGGLTSNQDGSITTNGVVTVGQYHPNAFGLYDMLGNVSEVSFDSGEMWDDGDKLTDRLNVISGNQHGVLGGNYLTDGSIWPISPCQMSLHNSTTATRYDNIGIRLAFFDNNDNPYLPVEE